MKRLTLLASVLLTISATSVQAQSVICEKFGSGQIIANRVCPLGYVKKGEVATTNGGGFGSAGMRAAQDMINRNEADRQARLARQAAAAEAQRQREHEERMLRLQKSQSSNPQQRRANAEDSANSSTRLKEQWDLVFTSDGYELPAIMTIYEDCSATLKSDALGVSKIPRITKTAKNMGFNIDADDNDSKFPVSLSTRMTESSEFSGHLRVGDGVMAVKGNRTRKVGMGNAACIPRQAEELVSFPENSQSKPSKTYASPNSSDSERGSNLVEDLSALGKLHTDGILTDEEFNAAKRRLLGL